VKKCRRLVLTFADYGSSRSSFLPHVEFFIEEHERLEREGGPEARGFGDCWYFSLVYGYSNFGLRCYATAPGSCAGPMDVKHWPRVTDPRANIRWHCREMLTYYKRGVRGRDLCEWVFLPANPRDWGGGRFARTDRLFRDCLRRGYEFDRLP
jgi:hypothetical protein